MAHIACLLLLERRRLVLGRRRWLGVRAGHIHIVVAELLVQLAEQDLIAPARPAFCVVACALERGEHALDLGVAGAAAHTLVKARLRGRQHVAIDGGPHRVVVEGVVADGVPEELRVHADLVRAPGDGAAHEHARVGRRIVRQALEQRAARLALRVHNVQAALPVDAEDRLAAVDEAVGKVALHAAHVRLVHEAGVEVVAELAGGLFGRGAHHDAGREAVEAVARVHLGYLRLLLDHLDECVVVVAPRRVHGNAAWLDHHEAPARVVAVQDLHGRVGDGRLMAVHAIDQKVAVLDAIRGRDALPIHRAEPMVDGPQVILFRAIAKLGRKHLKDLPPVPARLGARLVLVPVRREAPQSWACDTVGHGIR